MRPLILLLVSVSYSSAQVNSTNLVGTNNSLPSTATRAALISSSGSTNAGTNSVIMGSGNSRIGTASLFSLVAGGQSNANTASLAVVLGGFRNALATNAARSVLLGGTSNSVASSDALLAGGLNNLIASNSTGAFVGGGQFNEARAQGAVVLGGFANEASGTNSFAVGRQAVALHSGTFVWSDSSSTSDFISATNNQFIIRAQRGVGINTNNPGTNALFVNGSARVSGVLFATSLNINGVTNFMGPQGPAGPVGPQGAAGANGRTVLSGASLPTSTVGQTGDFYVNTASRQIFGPKGTG